MAGFVRGAGVLFRSKGAPNTPLSGFQLGDDGPSLSCSQAAPGLSPASLPCVRPRRIGQNPSISSSVQGPESRMRYGSIDAWAARCRTAFPTSLSPPRGAPAYCIRPYANDVSPLLYWRSVGLIISKGLAWPRQWLLFPHPSTEEAPVSEAPLSCPGPRSLCSRILLVRHARMDRGGRNIRSDQISLI